MKSSPAASPSRASARQSGQLADQRSGTLVAERPDEQLAPNRPILSAFPLYMAILFFIDALGASTAVPPWLAAFLVVALAIQVDPTDYPFLTRCRKFNRMQTMVVALSH